MTSLRATTSRSIYLVRTGDGKPKRHYRWHKSADAEPPAHLGALGQPKVIRVPANKQDSPEVGSDGRG